MKKFYALGRLKAGQMNKTEAQYAALLDLYQKSGDILWYKFEGVKLRLADRTFYEPDFIVMRNDGSLEIHEVKGFMQEDSNVKIKVAADLYPFKFLLIRKKGKLWSTEEI